MRLGLIPARAGKTGLIAAVSAVPEAHPRAGGENGKHPYSMSSPQGSSPRGRGKRAHDYRLSTSVRLIPARAGKTGVRGGRPELRPAHPRAGGENTTETSTLPDFEGSSPRGRGKPSVLGPFC